MPHKSKIGVDISVLEYNREGIGQYLLGLLPEILKHSAFQWILFTSSNSLIEELATTLPNGNYEFRIIEKPVGKRSGFGHANILAEAARGAGVDILISTHSHLIPLVFPKVWWLIHDIGPILYPQYFGMKGNFLKRLLFNWLFKRSLHKSNLLLTTSHAIAQEIEQSFGVEQNRIISLGAAPANWAVSKADTNEDKAILQQYGLRAEEYYLAIGTLSPRKNYEKVLAGYVELLLEGRFKRKLVIAGKKGWDYEPIFAKFERLKREYPGLELDKMVIFTDYLPGIELNCLTRNCRIMINASLYEGFGIPPLEGLLHYKPIILSDIPVYRELYSQVGHFFMPTNATELAHKIRDIENDYYDELQRLQEFVPELQSRYNWKSVANKLIEQLDARSI